ncbi:MAG: hypothetical protein MJ137_07235, partial [Clostridia bacterium]|nr:hypothetical protein [Clostridia bacterium]
MKQSLIDKTVEKIKAIPKWGWLIGPGCVAVNETFYLTGPVIAEAIGTAEHAVEPIIPAIDGIIPLIPAFILIYVYSYAFWIIGLIVLSLTGKKNLVNTLTAMFGCFFTAFLIYIFLPTKQDRAALGLIEAASRPGIFNRLLLFIYNSDGGEIATNMLPSQHVMYSIFCYIGIRKQPTITKGFRIYSFIVMSLIILATLFTRQHY